jgi:hypothetical protein
MDSHLRVLSDVDNRCLQIVHLLINEYDMYAQIPSLCIVFVGISA